jgi:MIP family channel proteins
MDQGAKSYWAEFLGTFTLCLIGEGAICTQQLIGGGGGLLAVAVAHGLALAVMISAFGAVSGGHFNPAVTMGFLVTGKQSLGSAIRYWISQLLGAVVASALVAASFPAAVWQSARLGAAVLHPEVSVVMGLVIELVMTFFLVTAVWGTAVDPRAPKIGGFGIGLSVTMGILFGGPLTGGAMNPARAFGPALIAGAWEHHWLWWVGPLAGGALAGWIYNGVVMPKEGARS